MTKVSQDNNVYTYELALSAGERVKTSVLAFKVTSENEEYPASSIRMYTSDQTHSIAYFGDDYIEGRGSGSVRREYMLAAGPDSRNLKRVAMMILIVNVE